MADFTDRIKLVFEAVTSDATKNVGQLKGATQEAQSGWGKLSDVAGQTISKLAASPAAVAAAGVAIAKVAVDLVSGFSEAALSAQNFATASGLSVEQASRWQEVAGDVGVSTETLEGAVNKLNQAAAKGALEQLGIGGGDTNEQLLNALEHLKGIDDSSQRAAEGAKLFGKSWTQLAPLVEESGNLRDNLAAVSDQKVIDEKEVAKAREWRDAIDTLNDQLDDLKLALGEALIGPLTDVAQTIGNVTGAVDGLTSAIPGMPSAFEMLTSPLRNVADGFETLTDSSSSLTDRARGLGQAVTGAIPGPLGSWASGLFDVSDSSDDAAEATQRMNDQARIQAQAASDAEAALKSYSDAVLATINSNLGLADAADKTTDAVAKYNEANATAAATNYGTKASNDALSDAQRAAEKAALAQAAAAVKLGQDQATATGAQWGAEEATRAQVAALEQVKGTLDPNSPLARDLQGYIDQLGGIPQSKSTVINADTQTAAEKVQALTDQIYAITGKVFSFIIKGNTASGSAAATAPSGASVGAQALGAPVAGASVASGVTMPTFVPQSTGGAVAPSVIINVSVAPLTNPADVGAKVADYLDAFYRRSGQRRAVAA